MVHWKLDNQACVLVRNRIIECYSLMEAGYPLIGKKKKHMEVVSIKFNKASFTANHPRSRVKTEMTIAFDPSVCTVSRSLCARLASGITKETSTSLQHKTRR